MLEVTDTQRKLAAELRRHIYPWRQYTIAVDGPDAAGKSVLARYLGWDLNISVIETDLYIVPNAEPPSYRYDDLRSVIEARYRLDRPLIIEGVFLLHTLDQLGVGFDYLIYVESDEDHGSEYLRHRLAKYQKAFKPRRRADCRFISEFADV